MLFANCCICADRTTVHVGGLVLFSLTIFFKYQILLLRHVYKDNFFFRLTLVFENIVYSVVTESPLKKLAQNTQQFRYVICIFKT